MSSNINFQLKDLDIYSNKIGLFYNNKENLSSYFGLILTCLYSLSLVGLFTYYTNEAIKKRNLKVYSSDQYPEGTPSINLNNDIFYFAFGVEDPIHTTVYINETIYYPEVVYHDSVKENNQWRNKVKKKLELEKCNISKFSEGHQKLFKNNDLSTYYCVKDFNGIKLAGSYTYDEIAYLKIFLYPCKNTTENNNHCQSKDIIDSYLSEAYFSSLMENIGLTPTNYENPTTPTINNIYTTIGKTIFRERILYYKIEEIVSNVGIFGENIETKKYLKYDKESETFYIRDPEEFYNGNSICQIHVRLSDTIEVQNRIYGKISDVLSTTGGYMQLINLVFSVISYIYNKYHMKYTLIENLFCYNLEKNKLILKYDFEKSNKYKNYKNDFSIYVSNFKNNITAATNKILNFKSSFNLQKQSIIDDERNKKIDKFFKLGNSKSISRPEHSFNKILNESNSVSVDMNKMKNVNSVILLNKRNRLMKINDYVNNSLDNGYTKSISKLDYFKLNFFKYCFYHFYKNTEKKEFELYQYGIGMVVNQLDIINVFNNNFFCDNYLKKMNSSENFG